MAMKTFKGLFTPSRTASVSVLVRNDTTHRPMQNVTCNLMPTLVRHDTMEGKDYLVVPMVMLTEGVHKGSEGPLYYPKDELSKTPAVWNHKPVVVYHPEINGVGVSACQPEILTNHKIGVVMNTHWEQKSGRLKSEAWIDPSRADAVDPRIMEAINNNTVMELSTGVFVDSESDQGVWGKEQYVGVARNYRPDHLAVLPDKIGACSIKDGAGFLRNQSSSQASGSGSNGVFKSPDAYGPQGQYQVSGMNPPKQKGGRLSKVERENQKRLKQAIGPGDPSTYEPGVAGESSLRLQQEGEPTQNAAQGGFLVTESDGTEHLPTTTGGKPDHRLMGAAWAALHGGYRGSKYGGPNKQAAIAKLKKLYKSEGMDLPAGNEEGRLARLVALMAQKLGITANEDTELPFDYIRSQLSDRICDDCGCNAEFYTGPRPWIVDVYPNFFIYEYNGELYQLSYTTSDEGVTLGDEDPVEVERTPPQYRPVQMAAGGPNSNTNHTMNKEQLITQLIGNSSGALTEADRPRLNAFSIEQLKKIGFAPIANQQAGAPVTNAGKGKDAADSEDDDEDEDGQPMAKGKKGKKANNQAETPITVNEYIENAPGEVREILSNGLAAYNEEKATIVKKLVAVKNSGYTEQELSSKPLGELRKLARLAKVDAPAAAPRMDFSGMAPLGNDTPDQEALVAPTMNFTRTETTAVAAK
jgi:hypothetical protein